MREYINIVEAAGSDTFKSSQFPILMGHLSDRRRSQMETVFQLIGARFAEGQIANVEFKDSKDTYNRALEEAWRAMDDNLTYSAWRDDDLDKKTKDFLYGFHYPRADLVAGQLKKATTSPVASTNATLKILIPFLREIEVFSAALVSLKDKVVKRVIKSDEEKRAERFVPPPAKTKAAQMTIDALQEVANASYEQLKTNLIRNYKQAAENYAKKALEASENPDLLPRANKWSDRKVERLYPSHVLGGGEAIATQKVIELVRENGKEYYKLKSDAHAVLEETAIEHATEMRDEFVVKNAKKLAPIMDNKPDVQTVKEIGHSVSVNGFTGTIKCEFQDGSSFIVHNSVVYNVSKLGTSFLQFPLRFSSVILPNGERMKQPSEARMHEIFVKA